MILALLLVFQAISLEEINLYNKILDEAAPAARLKLIQQFEREYPKSKRAGEIYGLAMEVYRGQNNHAKMLEFGEKSIKADPENLQALTIMARQYALEGRNLDKAADYARRAKVAVGKKKTGPKPQGVLQPAWNSYLQQMEASADWTLNYVRTIGTSVLGRRPPS